MASTDNSSALRNVDFQLDFMYTTPYLHSEEVELRAGLIFNILYITVGLIGCSFNAFMVTLYFTRRQLQKHISFLMLQLFIFCMFQGFVTAVINVLQRELRYTIQPWWCAIGHIIIEFFDDFVLVLLIMLVVERYALIQYPLLRLKPQKINLCSKIALVVGACLTAGVCLLPFAPSLNIPERFEAHIRNPALQKKLLMVHDAEHCHGLINKTNIASPIITIILEAVSVLTVLILYLRMYVIARNRLSRFGQRTRATKLKLKRAAISIMVVAAIFFITVLPYGLILQLRALCNIRDYQTLEQCHYISHNLTHGFSVLAHLATFLAPLMFTAFSPNIRHLVLLALLCQKKDNPTRLIFVIPPRNATEVK